MCAGQAIGLTLSEITEIAAFRDRDEEPCSELVAAMERRLSEIDARIRELTSLREQLADVLKAAHEPEFANYPPSTTYGLLRSMLAICEPSRPGSRPEPMDVGEIRLHRDGDFAVYPAPEGSGHRPLGQEPPRCALIRHADCRARCQVRGAPRRTRSPSRSPPPAGRRTPDGRAGPSGGHRHRGLCPRTRSCLRTRS